MNHVIEKVGVVGAGTMGHGIAMEMALNGVPTILYDISEEALQEARKKVDRNINLFKVENYEFAVNLDDIDSYLQYSSDLHSLADVDFVTETASENIEVKHAIFEQLDDICKADAILASNTSSLSLSDVFSSVKNHRQQSVLTHWFNPPHLVPLVEILRSEETTDETYTKVKAFLESMGKVTIEVKKETPGLVANRIQAAMAREVLTLLEEGIADARDLDKAITSGPGFRLSTSGLLEIMDFGGIDVWTKVIEELQPVIASGTKEFESTRTKVEEGNLGVKTGKGFFEYPGKSFDSFLLERDRTLLKHLKNIKKIEK